MEWMGTEFEPDMPNTANWSFVQACEKANSDGKLMVIPPSADGTRIFIPHRLARKRLQQEYGMFGVWWDFETGCYVAVESADDDILSDGGYQPDDDVFPLFADDIAEKFGYETPEGWCVDMNSDGLIFQVREFSH